MAVAVRAVTDGGASPATMRTGYGRARPPGPPARNTSMRRSFSLISTSTSSASGSTATVAVDVWMRPWLSVLGTRWTRWTPLSNFMTEYTWSPLTLNWTSL